MIKLLKREKTQRLFGPVAGSGTIEHCQMTSDVLGVDKEFSVYLPAGYEEGSIAYPVMYLLHPAGGTHELWISHGHLPEIADNSIRSGMSLPLIIVMPDGSGTGEHNLGKHMGFFSLQDWDYENYFNKELIPLVETTYRVLKDKRYRAIAGASMGGEAAISYAQKYPDLYGASCALSGILGHPEQSIMALTDKEYGASLIKNDPSQFMEKASDDIIEKLKEVRWYADCGDNDFFIQGNVEFLQVMKKKSVSLDFRIRSGVHGWYYWITGLAPILRFISTGFEGAGIVTLK